MKKHIICILLATLAAGTAIAAPTEPVRVVQSFDAGWRFLPADASGAAQPDFADGAWRLVDVPHDWSIAGAFAETNRTGPAGAYLPSGIGWYRKHFSLPNGSSGRQVAVEFDGVMANSEVWINGFYLGKRPFGYVSFGYDLTRHLKFGDQENVLAVRADNSVQPASRWYSGAGIYRHVRLVVTDPVHVGQWGVFVTTPEVSRDQATVGIQTWIDNQATNEAGVTARTQIYELNARGQKTGPPVASQGLPPPVIRIAAGLTATSPAAVLHVVNPKLWSVATPNLYQAVTTVTCDGRGVVDVVTTTFGIRDAKFVAATGFWLNGENLKIKGVCVHVDGGAFGAAVPLGVWEQRLTELKKLGVNAVRTAHNPPAPEFLDLCDRLGLLVMDELFDCWTVGKNSLAGERLADYHLNFQEWSSRDTGDTVRRDRNHPSIILYSAGNEIHDTPNAELAKGILTRLVGICHANDPTRPVTQALFRPNTSHDYDNGLADLLDVVGQNYRENEVLAAHAQNPARKIIGTENGHTRATWLALRDHAPYAGQFLWTGVDYLGEARRWPVICSGSGLLDRTGTPRPLAYERQSWWSDTPMVCLARRTSATASTPDNGGVNAADRRPQGVFSDWTPANLEPHAETVEVYSNCKEVELFLNGQSLGVKAIPPDASPRLWNVTFAPGTLKAVARRDGNLVATDELQTAGPPARIVLFTETRILAPGWDAVARVIARIVDAQGIVVPRASDLVSFSISGPGVIAAVDNADNSSHELFQTDTRHAFRGQCVAFVQATAAAGEIKLQATAAGLQAGALTLTAAPELSK
jgi:beta-galactosidase